MFNAVLNIFFAVAILVSSASSFAGPRISWNYKNVKNNSCHQECASRVLGQCVQWREVCNRRTKYAWSDNNKSLIKRAMNILSTRITNSRTKTCVRNNVELFRTKYAPSGKKEALAWGDYSALAGASQWPDFDLVAWRENSSTTGRAYLSRKAKGQNGRLVWGSNRIKMEINLTAVERSASNNGSAAAAEDFAGTIFHEMLHQMGHDHPGTGNYNKDYMQGHFVTVAGDCVASDGSGARNKGFSLVGGRSWYRVK